MADLPLEAPPAFFRRVWMPPLAPPLVIFGRYAPSEFPQDTPRERESWETRGMFPAECFSLAEPDGEWGMVAVTAGVMPITEQEFEAARARGWLP